MVTPRVALLPESGRWQKLAQVVELRNEHVLLDAQWICIAGGSPGHLLMLLTCVLDNRMQVRSLTVALDGTMIVAANNNGTCYVWRMMRGEHRAALGRGMGAGRRQGQGRGKG